MHKHAAKEPYAVQGSASRLAGLTRYRAYPRLFVAVIVGIMPRRG